MLHKTRAQLLTLPGSRMEAAAVRLAEQVSDETLRRQRENLSAALRRDGDMLRRMAEEFPVEKLALLGIASKAFVAAMHDLADRVAVMAKPQNDG